MPHDDNLLIATWNVNSVRARLPIILDFLSEFQPDIFLMQEIKSTDDNFPSDEFTGYNIITHGQKAYNGVATFTKSPAEKISTNFLNNPVAEESRFLEVALNTKLGYLRIINLYVPNGGEKFSDKYYNKLKFLDSLYSYLAEIKTRDELLILGGDLNVAPYKIDVWDHHTCFEQTCATLDERAKLRSILALGFSDIYRLLNPNKVAFSWWNYQSRSFSKNQGMRIDFLISCMKFAEYVTECQIVEKYREKEKTSDHAPVILKMGSTLHRGCPSRVSSS